MGEHMRTNIKYAVMGGIFGMSATVYANQESASAKCESFNAIASETNRFHVARYERVVTMVSGQKRYERRRRRFTITPDNRPTPPTSGGAAMPVPPREERSIYPHSYNLKAA